MSMVAAEEVGVVEEVVVETTCPILRRGLQKLTAETDLRQKKVIFLVNRHLLL